MSIDPLIFRAYDIRGKALTALTEEACRLTGQGFGSVLREQSRKEHPKIAVGRDARTHGPLLERALAEGLLSTGCQIFEIGQTPSPVNYFTICDRGLDGGVQVTASHNPAEDNGLKLQTFHAEAFAGMELQSLRKRIERRDFLTGKGNVETIDAEAPYRERLTSLFGSVGRGISLAADFGNGVSGPLYSAVLRGIGASVTELFSEPDGNFPNHPADPSKRETLRELQSVVLEKRMPLGIAFDGDGDRLGLVDEKGVIRSADEILLLLAEDHLQRNPGGTIVFTVSNSGILESETRRLGGIPHMCKVGHSFVEHAMRETGALLGGEQSGHFFCAEGYFGFDDALVTALHVLRILKQEKKPLSEILSRYPRVFQSPEKRPHCPDEKKSSVIEHTSEYFSKHYPVLTKDGARIDFGEGAWAGIRQSNTSPCLSICMEARSEEKLAEVEKIILDYLKTYPEIRW